MDAELNKQLSLIRNKGALTNGVPVSETYNNTTDSLENIKDVLGNAVGASISADIAAVQTDVGNPSARTNFQSLETMLGIPDAVNSNVDDILRTGFDSSGTSANRDGAVLERLEDLRASYIAGKSYILEVSVTSAANAGDVTLATVTTQPCLIKSVVVHSDTASQADLTSAAVYGGASKVVTILDTAQAAKANIDAIDEQVAWTGAVRLAATKTVVMTLAGTGATAVDLTVTIEYQPCVDGGYLA